MFDADTAVWRKSSRSNDQGLCIEVADNRADVIGVRDSKDPGPMLAFEPSGWAAFVAATKAGRFGR